jgi:hypothetical protein
VLPPNLIPSLVLSLYGPVLSHILSTCLSLLLTVSYPYFHPPAQWWIYPADKQRPNEFGFQFEKDKEMEKDMEIDKEKEVKNDKEMEKGVVEVSAAVAANG